MGKSDTEPKARTMWHATTIISLDRNRAEQEIAS
jgi:hypothetical protein